MSTDPVSPSGQVQFLMHERLAFSRAEYARRYDQVLNSMRRLKLDALLVRTPENITYLTGYETPGYYGYHCLVVTLEHQPVLVGRYLELYSNVPEFSWLTHTVYVPDGVSAERTCANALRSLGLERARLGVEKGGFFFTVRESETLASELPHATFVDATMILDDARMIKSEEEVAVMRRATAIADAALLAGIDAVAPGVTEDDIAAAVHDTWCRKGAEYTGLPNFIVSGERTGICHATWRGRRLANDDICIMEIAASKHRYAGAVFRGVTVGKVNPRFRLKANATIEALNTLIEAIRPGVVAQEVHRIGHDVFVKHGLGEEHRSRCAYSLGVNYPPDWGEGQIISIREGETRSLQENMTFHVTPGVIVRSEGMGICTSATIRVSATGCEVLNTVPIKLFEK